MDGNAPEGNRPSSPANNVDATADAWFKVGRCYGNYQLASTSALIQLTPLLLLRSITSRYVIPHVGADTPVD